MQRGDHARFVVARNQASDHRVESLVVGECHRDLGDVASRDQGDHVGMLLIIWRCGTSRVVLVTGRDVLVNTVLVRQPEPMLDTPGVRYPEHHGLTGVDLDGRR